MKIIINASTPCGIHRSLPVDREQAEAIFQLLYDHNGGCTLRLPTEDGQLLIPASLSKQSVFLFEEVKE